MPCARRLPLLVAAPAPPRALQTFCSCHLGRQFLGAMLLGAACICASGILNAGPWLPGLCAPHDESLLVCLPPGRRACEPCMHMQTWHSLAVGLSPVLERDPFVVVVCRHTLLRTAPQSCSLRSVLARDVSLPLLSRSLLPLATSCYRLCYRLPAMLPASRGRPGAPHVQTPISLATFATDGLRPPRNLEASWC